MVISPIPTLHILFLSYVLYLRRILEEIESMFPSGQEMNSARKPLLRNNHFKGRDNTTFALHLDYRPLTLMEEACLLGISEKQTSNVQKTDYK